MNIPKVIAILSLAVNIFRWTLDFFIPNLTLKKDEDLGNGKTD